jgi:nitroreductase
MDFREVVRRRHMTRTYTERPVPRDVLERVLDAGVRAPSAGFSQGWAFVVLEGPDQTALFWSMTGRPVPPKAGGRQAGMRTAPVIILPLADKRAYLDRYTEPDKAGLGLDVEDGWPAPYWDIDTAFATMSLLLAATDEGLGALFFGIFQGERALLDALGVPAHLHAIGALALGYPASGDVPSPSLARGRKPIGAVVHWHTWGGDDQGSVEASTHMAKN